MNSQELNNLQEAYLDVYYDLEEEKATKIPYRGGRDLADRMRASLNIPDESKPPSGKKGDGSGYGDEDKMKGRPLMTVNPGDPTQAKKVLHQTRQKPHKQTGNPTRIFGFGKLSVTRGEDEVRGMTKGPEINQPKARSFVPKAKKKASTPSREIVRKTKKEDFELWVNNLLDEGYDLSGYTWEGLYEEYIQNEAYDIYDVILSHLIDEGYADTFESAEAIMVNMSEDWRESIVEDFPNVQNKPRPGDAGTRGLTKTPTGYINRHSRGDDLPEPTVNKIMGGNLMVKNGTKKNTNSNIA